MEISLHRDGSSNWKEKDMNPEFTCGFATIIKEFIEVKIASGHPYDSSTAILRRFDRMVKERFPASSTITQEISDAWITMNPDESPNTLLRRITPVRQLAKYMNAAGIQAYIIPGHIPEKYIQYEAHIFTGRELKAFFSAIDGCGASKTNPLLPYVVTVYFRMVFFCGMRGSEARCLSVDDVNLETGRITIRASKGWKARTVFMSEDLLKTCCLYDGLMSKLCPGRTAFFPKPNGQFYSRRMPDQWFHKFWEPLPEAKCISGNPPRVHDLRHTYATTRINEWVKEGKDLNVLYPYISEYMGHSQYASTDYYLQLVPAFYPELNHRMRSVDESILPEVTDDEES